MQFRKHLPEPKLHDLMDVFRARKEFFLKMIDLASKLVGKTA
jgi:hypothetical protein